MTKSGGKFHKTRTLPHHAVDDFGRWLARRPEPQPEVSVSVALCVSGYKQLELPEPRAHHQSVTTSLPDTGAQMVVCGMGLVHKMGLKRRDLIPLANGIRAANNQGIKLLGGILITITGKGEDGQTRTSDQLCYVAEGLQRLFLSKAVCRDLGIISPTFPAIGTFDGKLSTQSSLNKCSLADPENPHQAVDGRPCSCPTRTLPPTPPSQLPLERMDPGRVQ